MLGKIDLSVNFFIMNIGLNVAVAVSSSKIDCCADHFGGFTAGLTVCALMDILERGKQTRLSVQISGVWSRDHRRRVLGRIKDVGFVGAALRAERKRRQGM
jgi:hypothetical protein